DEQRRIRLGRRKPDGAQEVGEAVKPGAGGLLEPIQGLVEEADVVGVRVVDEAGRQLTVDTLRELALEKGIIDIHLVQRPLVRSGDGEDGANGGRLDDGAERFIEVD
uniref:Uncharacterized protein n=1 Tax=Triticum urartu TaxID=4572 RepID=A0A8R7P959_TRIUA